MQYTKLNLSPSALANTFLAFAKRDGVDITPMKLLKLVYIAYGWSLALLKKKLFEEPIEAWNYGPVIPSLYHEFKHFSSKPISRFSAEDARDLENGEILVEYPVLEDQDVIKVFSSVWGFYKDKSAPELSAITHQPGGPWEKARFGDGFLKDEEIEARSQERINQLLS